MKVPTRQGHLLSSKSFPSDQMLLRHNAQQTLRALRTLHSQAAAIAAQEISIPPLDYLEGFPRPDPKHNETIIAIPRSKSGKIISGKERKEWRVPSIVFEQEDGQHGGNKRLISVQSKQIRKLVNHVGHHFFLSRLFNLEVRSEFDDSGEIIEKVRVLPRKVRIFIIKLINVVFLIISSPMLFLTNKGRRFTFSIIFVLLEVSISLATEMSENVTS